MFRPFPAFAARGLLCAALLALTLPAASWAALVAPSRADTGPAPARGVELYVAPGAPAAAVGGDIGVRGFALGAELTWLWPGALRPELHARRPFALGRALLSPHLSATFFLAAGSFGGAPAANTLEAGAGLAVGASLGRLTPFADFGFLGFLDPRYRSHTRIFGVAAAGARFQLARRIALAGWVGTMASVGRFAPAGGLWATMQMGAGGGPGEET